jgi:LemA protein
MDNIGSYIFWGVIAALVIYIISIYNHLVRIKHNVSKAWSNIDVLLKQRHDEIPKLVETCKQYMKFEQETLEKVMQARSQVSEARQKQDVPGLGAAEGALRMGLGQLFALAEDYPELRANENFQHLQGRISTLENTIADRREFYNESVNINNIAIDTFPDLIVARLFGFGPRDLLEFEAGEIADVSVKELFET